MEKIKMKWLTITLLIVFFICDLFAQIEDDNMKIIARPDQSLTYTQIKNLLKSVRRNRYHIYEEHSVDSMMVPGAVWRDTSGYLKYMDWYTDSTGEKYQKIWILNNDNTESLITDTNNITGDGQENYYALWNGAKSLVHSDIRKNNGRNIIPNLTTMGRVDINNGPLRFFYASTNYGYSDIYDLYGELFIESNSTNILGGLSALNGAFQLQGSGLHTLSLDINLNNSPIKSNRYMIVANPAPGSASNGDVVANRFVSFTNTSKVGITEITQYIAEIRKNPSDTTKTQIKYGMIEVTGGIVTTISANNNWVDIP